MAPVLALALGAATATGAYALLDSEKVVVPDTRVIVAQPPAPSDGVMAKNEAGVAAAIAAPATAQSGTFASKDQGSVAARSTQPQTGSFVGKDEAGTAAAIGNGSAGTGLDDQAQSERRTDPHGPASGLP